MCAVRAVAVQQLFLVGAAVSLSLGWGVHDGDGCWLLQWQKLLVSSGDKAARVSVEKHYGVLSCESCREALDVARAVEVLSSKDCWGPPQSRPLETPASPSARLM